MVRWMRVVRLQRLERYVWRVINTTNTHFGVLGSLRATPSPAVLQGRGSKDNLSVQDTNQKQAMEALTCVAVCLKGLSEKIWTVQNP